MLAAKNEMMKLHRKHMSPSFDAQRKTGGKRFSFGNFKEQISMHYLENEAGFSYALDSENYTHSKRNLK